MNTKVGRYPSAKSFGKGQCVVEVNGFFELGVSEENRVEGIVSEVGETISNGIIQIDLEGGHPAVAHEHCWVDKNGYIFSRANIPYIPEPEPEPEPEEPEPEDNNPVIRPFPVNPYIELWKAEKFSITLKVHGTGTVLSSAGKDWLVVTEEGVRFDNIFIPCKDPLRITIDKHNHQTSLTVNGLRVVEHGQVIVIERIGNYRLFSKSFPPT